MIQKSQLPLILATAFLDLLGFGILIPILPDLIAGFGVGEAWTAYSQGVVAIGTFIGGLFFGKMSDIYGRKRMMIFTSLLSLLGYVFLYISLSPTLMGVGNAQLVLPFIIFLGARFLGGLGGAGFGVIQAYISDISTPAEKTKNMGMIGAAFGFAFLVGPAIGGALSSFGIQFVIIGCILALTANFLMILFRLQEPRKHAEVQDIDLKEFHFSREVITLLLISFGTTLAFSSVQSGSTQFYADVFGFDTAMRGYTMALIGFIAVIYQAGLVRYVRRIFSEIQMIHIALFLMFISLGLFAMNKSPFWLFWIIPLFPLAMGSFGPSVSSLMAAKAGKEVGKVMGYNTSVTSIGQMIGPFVVGTLYLQSPTLPFYASALFSFLLFLVAIFGLKK